MVQTTKSLDGAPILGAFVILCWQKIREYIQTNRLSDIAGIL